MADSDKLYAEKIDVGLPALREIASGLQKFIPLEEMRGPVMVITNLKPRKLAGFLSSGMVFCASSADHTKVELMIPQGPVKIGERIGLEGEEIAQEYQKELNPKKKEFEKLAPYFRTDAEGFACFGAKRLVHSGGYIKAKTLTNSIVS